MRRKIEVALVALALLGTAAAVPAAAQVHISINPGSVAYGYNDGYWDRDHHWHPWPKAADRDWYRKHYAAHYDDHRHDRVADQGWHASDRWWEHEHH